MENDELAEYIKRKGIRLEESQAVPSPSVQPAAIPSEGAEDELAAYVKRKGIPIDGQAVITPAAEVSQKEKDIELADLARLFTEGYTMGGGAEVSGGLRATIEPDQLDWYEAYRKKRLEEEAAIKQFKEQHPYVAYPTEFAGAVVSPVNKLLAPLMAGKKGAELLAGATKTGLASGLITGVGTSEKTLEQPLEYGKDILATGATGAVLSPVLTGAGMAITGKAPEILKQIEESSEIGKNLITAFRESAKGKGFIFKEGQERLAKQEEAIAQEFAEKMYGKEGPLAKTSKELSDYFKAAEDAGASVAGIDEKTRELYSQFIEDLELNQLLKVKTIEGVGQGPRIFKLLKRFQNVTPSMSSGEVKVFLDEMDKMLVGNGLTPSEAYNLGRWLNGENVPGFAKIQGSKFADLVRKSGLSEHIKKLAKESAEERLGKNSESIFQKFADVRAGTVDTVLNKGKPRDVAQVWQNEYAKDEIKSQLFDDFKKIIDELQDPSKIGDESRNTIRVLQQRIGELNQKYPDLKLDIKDFIDRLKDVSSQRTVRNKLITAHGSSASAKDIFSKMVDWTGYGGAILTGKLIGRPIVATKQIFSNMLTKASPEKLSPIANELGQTKGLEHVGKALQDSIDSGSIAAKNAALFMILQNPHASSIAKSYLGEE